MYLSWILLVACSIWIGLLVFCWALYSGQFSDQNRARYLALAADLQKVDAQSPPWRGPERFFYIGLAGLWLLSFAAAVYFGWSRG